ncbi:MAG: N-acetylmuramoyl-L-alanine amidase [Ilyomonas sp.]
MKWEYYTLILILFIAGVCSCSRNPYRTSNKLYKVQAKAFSKTLRAEPTNSGIDSVALTEQWIGTTNFNMRKPNFVVIHHTAQNACDETLKTFTVTRSQVSAHYVICKDGTVHHMLNDYLRAWHGGIAKWGNVTDVNSSSIGIEIDNNGFETFTDAQISSLLHVLKYLKTTYHIPAANFIGHGDIAPVRKNDPNPSFPWKLLAEQGYGLWYTDTTGTIVPAYFDNMQALRIIGYDTRDSSAAIQAFKRHFEQDTSRVLNEADQKILYNLYRQY